MRPLEIIHQTGVSRVGLYNGQHRTALEAEWRIRPFIQIDRHAHIAGVLAIVVGGDGNRLGQRASGEGECAADRGVLLPFASVGLGRGVIHGHSARVGAAQFNGQGGGSALVDADLPQIKGDGERLVTARIAVNHHVIEVIGDIGAVCGQRAKGPAVDLLTAEAVIWRTVANLFAGKVISKVERNELPTREVIHKGVAPNFGIARGGAGVAVVANLEQQVVARVLAIDPEANPLKTAPILGDPCVHCFVLKSVGSATPANHVGIELVEDVVPCLPRQGEWIVISHGGDSNGDCCAVPEIAPCDIANVQPITIGASGDLAALEIVYDLGADDERHIIQIIGDIGATRGQRAKGPAVDLFTG